jgi:hypothetical protein
MIVVARGVARQTFRSAGVFQKLLAQRWGCRGRGLSVGQDFNSDRGALGKVGSGVNDDLAVTDVSTERHYHDSSVPTFERREGSGAAGRRAEKPRSAGRMPWVGISWDGLWGFAGVSAWNGPHAVAEPLAPPRLLRALRSPSHSRRPSRGQITRARRETSIHRFRR